MRLTVDCGGFRNGGKSWSRDVEGRGILLESMVLQGLRASRDNIFCPLIHQMGPDIRAIVGDVARWKLRPVRARPAHFTQTQQPTVL